MDEILKNKYKRYLTTRSSRDLTHYAINQLKKSKLCDDSPVQIEQNKGVDVSNNFDSYVDPVNEEPLYDSFDLPLTSHEYNKEDLIYNSSTLIDEMIENHLPNFVNENNQDDFPGIDDFLHLFFASKDEDDESMLFRNIKSFKELLETKGFFQKISTPVAISPSELLLMVLYLCKSLHLPSAVMSKLLTLINSIFEEPILPQSRYKLDQIFNEKNDVEFHAICPTCTGYLGNLRDVGDNAHCKICCESVQLSSSSCENVFVIIDPSIPIAEILEAHEDYYDYVVSERKTEDNFIKDIYDGIKYRDFIKSLPDEDKRRYVTTTFNTDGASPFKSAPSSVWPIYLMVNEIPPQDRFNNLIPCGLWFNKKKPNMMVFLDPFVDMMNNKVSKGITCTIKGEERQIKGYTLISCVDTVARAPIQGIKQFNGKFGCNWCLHPGKWEGSMKYPMYGEGIPDDIPARNVETTVECMKESIEDGYKPIAGVKHPSPFMYLEKHDLIEGFVPDYMHIILGVGKLVTNLLLKDQDVDLIQPLLLKIKCPHQIARLTRSLNDLKFWKCREWENWILYTSTPLLSLISSPTLIQYWTLFVASLYILLQSKVSLADIDKADEMLFEFVFKTQEYFGLSAMTFNIHALLHLAKSVLNWGQLWAHSAFAFEAGNHHMLQAVHCARGVNSQILRYINVNRSASILEKRVFPNASAIVKEYLSYTLKSEVKKHIKISTMTYFGKAFPIETENADYFNLPHTCKFFKRMVKDGCLYSSCLKVNQRSDNSFAQLDDGRFIQLDKFVVDFDNKEEYTLCNIVCTVHHNLSNNYPSLRKIRMIQKVPTIVATINIKTICIFMSTDDNNYICPLPNLLFY